MMERKHFYCSNNSFIFEREGSDHKKIINNYLIKVFFNLKTHPKVPNLRHNIIDEIICLDNKKRVKY